MRTELETLNWVRDLMRPLPQGIEKEKSMWIAGRYVLPEEYVLINLRQKVLRRIERVEEKCGVNK